MKTSEFIKKLDEHREKVVNVKQEYNLYDGLETTIITEQFTITYRNDKEPNGLIDIIAEYLKTPVEEREKEKKYYLKQIGFKEPYNTLNFGERTQNYFISEDDNISGFKNQFTQSEIDELPECYTHPAVWEQVEVECED